MFGKGTQKAELPLIIVCDDKEMDYANYLIQLIGQKDDAGDSIIGIEDGSVSAAIYPTQVYKDNLPEIPSTQHTLFIGHTGVANQQSRTIHDKFNMHGMHYGWLGKRAVLHVDDTSGDWIKSKDKKRRYNDFLSFSKERGMNHPDVLAVYEKFGGRKSNAAVSTGTAASAAAAAAIPVPVSALVGGVVAIKALLERNKMKSSSVRDQQYRTLIKVFYEDGLRPFMEG